MKLKTLVLGTIIWSYLCLTVMAQEVFRIALTKSVNETFPEIRKTLTFIEQDPFAPELINVLKEEVDSTRMASEINESLRYERIHAVIGPSSSLVPFVNDPQFIIHPSRPNTLSSYFVILRGKEEPHYLGDFAETNAVVYSEEFYLNRFVNLIQKCLFKEPPRPSFCCSSNGNVPDSFLNRISAILVKACGNNVVYPSRHYINLFEKEHGAISPTNYFQKDQKQSNLIRCLNEKAKGLEDDPCYKFRELETRNILKWLKKLQLDEKSKKDWEPVPAITRTEAVQLVFLRKHRECFTRILSYMQDRYKQLKGFYLEEKKASLLEALNWSAKTLFLLSEKENREARLAFAEVHYRQAREIHRAWDESHEGTKKLIEIFSNGEALPDYDFEVAEAAIEEYDRYFQFRPADVRPDFIYLYAKHNQALLHSLRQRQYFNRGNCAKVGLWADDCKKSHESEIAFSKLRKDLMNTLTSPESTYLKAKPKYKEFARVFKSLFGEDPPD